MFHTYNIYYFIDNFDRKEISKLKKNIIIIYRNYKNNNIEKEIVKIKNFCKQQQRKLFISNNLRIAQRHQLDGIYIPAFNKKLNYKNISFKKNFEIIGSAHNLAEIKNKENQGCKIIFISPIFQNSKKKFFLGVTKFNKLAKNTSKKVVALGGINHSNFRKLYCTNSSGFACIDWIKKNWPTFK